MQEAQTQALSTGLGSTSNLLAALGTIEQLIQGCETNGIVHECAVQIACELSTQVLIQLAEAKTWEA